MEVGDLFLSFRNLQCVLQFRPSTGEVIRVIDGPLAAQHDVDIVNDSTLVIFNNNVQENNGVYTNQAHKYPVSKDEVEAGAVPFADHPVRLRFGVFHSALPELMAEQGIMTSSEGLQEALPDGRWFLEEQNSGELWVVGPEGVLYHDVHASHHDGPPPAELDARPARLPLNAMVWFLILVSSYLGFLLLRSRLSVLSRLTLDSAPPVGRPAGSGRRRRGARGTGGPHVQGARLAPVAACLGPRGGGGHAALPWVVGRASG